MAKTVKGKAELVKKYMPEVEAYECWEVWTGAGGTWGFGDDYENEPKAILAAKACDCPTTVIHITIPAVK